MKMVCLVLVLVWNLRAAGAREEADKLFGEQKWHSAAEAYERYLKAAPQDATAWFQLGVSRHSLGEPIQAAQAYERARAAGYAPLGLLVRGAAAYSLSDQPDNALAWLEEALRHGAGFPMVNRLPGLAKLRQDPRYQHLAARYEHPCEQPDYRALDFWVGQWEVFSPQGQPVGANVVERTVNGCAISEHWTTTGGEGRSYSAYDLHTGTWRQTYIGSTGQVHQYTGNRAGDSMLMQAQLGDRTLRMRYTPQGPDQVRQFIEESTDGGKTWYPWFDGIYKRRKN